MAKRYSKQDGFGPQKGRLRHALFSKPQLTPSAQACGRHPSPLVAGLLKTPPLAVAGRDVAAINAVRSSDDGILRKVGRYFLAALALVHPGPR